MASSPISRLFAVDVLCLLVMVVAKIVSSVQTEKCLPHVDRIKYWAQIGDQFEVNCTLPNCDSKFETQIWQRNGKRVRSFRSGQAYFQESRRLKLFIYPVEESDEGEYSCHTKIHGQYQNIQLIIGVEPTTSTTTTSSTATTATTTIPTTPMTSTTHASSSIRSDSTATVILKVTTTPVRIITTTQLPVPFINKTKPTSAANNPRQYFKKLSVWSSLSVILFKYT